MKIPSLLIGRAKIIEIFPVIELFWGLVKKNSCPPETAWKKSLPPTLLPTELLSASATMVPWASTIPMLSRKSASCL